MNNSKITLKKLLYEHNTEANALLRASYSELETAITRYLKFIEDSPLIKDFIEDAVANHTPEGFDASAVVQSVSKNVYSKFGPFPPDYKGETAVVYLLLHALVEEHACNRDLLLMGYSHGSKRFDAWTKNFLEDVARRLIAGIIRMLTLEGIEMGLDSNASQINYFGNKGGAVAAMATDNATVTVSQADGELKEELDKILDDLKSSVSSLEVDCRQDASNAVEAMQEALAEEKPKASIVKTVMGALKDFNGCVAFANNVAALTTFIVTNYPGLLN